MCQEREWAKQRLVGKLDKVTMDKRLEFEQMVPKFTERPVKVCLCFDSSVVYNLIFFDLETTGYIKPLNLGYIYIL